jgi:hypothetical protein
MQFLKSLPFMVRTKAGVMLTHAGASDLTASEESAAMLLTFSHEDLLAEVDRLLTRSDILDFISENLQMSMDEYDRKSWDLLAVTGSDDPRYRDLLRGFIATSLEPEWPIVWDFFFTQCETNSGLSHYGGVLKRFLSYYQESGQPQKFLVTGHIPVRNGSAIIAERQLRMASWSHSRPREAGRYLLFDTARLIDTVHDLMECVHPIPQ